MDPRTSGVEQTDTLDDMEDTVEVDEVEVHRVQIERTRADIGETLDAIKDKLQPQTLMDQAKERASEVSADLAQKAKDTVHDVVQEARQAIPEVAHNAVSSAVDTAKDAVGGAVDTAKEKVSHAVDSARDKGSSVMDTVRENPMPYALIGMGLGWLYFSSRKQAEEQRRQRERYSYHEYRYMPGQEQGYSSEYRYTPGSERTYGSEYRSIPGREGRYDREFHYPPSTAGSGMAGASVSGNLDALRSERREMDEGTIAYSREYRGGMAGTGQERPDPMMDRIQHSASRIAEKAKDQARYATEGFQDTLEENPLAIGAIAMGVGAALGLLLPSTRYENRMMGETRDQLVENVQHKAHDVVEKVQHVAEETMETAKDTVRTEARAQGLTPKSAA